MIPILSLQDIHVHRAGRAVLAGASLHLTAGERLAVVGANGAGKTTLLRTIVGLERPVLGQITLFGHTCAAEPDFRAARRQIGFLFQDSDDQLFCPSVIEDVAFGPLNLGQTATQARARAMAVLETMGLAHLAPRFTHRLSGGEKRLVCLAGLFAMEPDLLLLDEPTNGVDAANAAHLATALAGFRGAMILVSHDDRFVAGLATRAMLLQEGRLVPGAVHSHPHLHAHPHIHRA